MLLVDVCIWRKTEGKQAEELCVKEDGVVSGNITCFLKKNIGFGILLTLETIVLIFSVAMCFGKDRSFQITSESFVYNQNVVDDLVNSENVDQELAHAGTRIGSGAYDVLIYYSVQKTRETDFTVNDVAGYVNISSEINPRAVRYNSSKLRNIYQKSDSRMWIRTGAGIDDLTISVVRKGANVITIDKVVFKEYRVYRVARCIGWICIFAIIDGLYVVFFAKLRNPIPVSKRYIILGIGLITLFASLPYLSSYEYRGDDLNFHLKRICALAEALKNGQIPNRIQFSLNDGYGYATPLYYGEILLIIPAILYLLGTPLQVSYHVFMILVNLSTAWIAYYCFKKMTTDWRKGLFGAVIYTCATYRLVDMWIRSAVGEVCALMFLPLLLYGFYHLYMMEDDAQYKLADCLPIIISLTGLIQTHTLSCEMAAVFIVLFVLIFIKKTFRRKRFLALVKCVIVIVLLNVWFLYPFIQSMQMDVLVNSQEYMPIEFRGYSLMQFLGIASGVQYDNNMHHFQGALGFALLCGILMFIYCSIQKENWKIENDISYKVAKYGLLFALIALLLASDLFPWDNLYHWNKDLAKYATMVQFPWRYVGWGVLFLSFVAVVCVVIIERKKSYKRVLAIMTIVVLGGAITNGTFLINVLNMDNKSMNTYYDTESIDWGYLVAGEYLFENSIDVIGKPFIESDQEVECEDASWDKNVYSFACKNTARTSKVVIVPVLAYDNYHVYLANGQEVQHFKDDYGRITFSVPENYEGKVEVRYIEPVSWHVVEIVSVCTLIALIGISIYTIRSGYEGRKENEKNILIDTML